MLDSGTAHLYHFTPHTLKAFVQSAGFEVLECELETQRTISLRHVRVVARKARSHHCAPTRFTLDGPSLNSIFRIVRWSEKRAQLTRVRLFLKHGFHSRPA